jgi:hypothetical protein
MATAHTTHLLRGKIGNLVFRIRDGKQIVHLALSENKEKQLLKRRMKRTAFRQNLQEFGGASKASAQIYRQVLQDINHLLRPRAHNLVTSRLKKAADHHIKSTMGDNTYHYAREIRLHDVWKALDGLDLSHPGAPTAAVNMTPVGPRHNPTALQIQGLREAARRIPAHGNARLELRVHLRQTDFEELAYSEKHQKWLPREPRRKAALHRGTSSTRPSEWIPAEAIPREGIRLDLPGGPEGDQFVSVVVIEWREVRTVDGKVITHHKQAVARIAAVHGTAEDFIQRPNPNAREPEKAPPAWEPAHDWHADPQAFIKEAMTFIRT